MRRVSVAQTVPGSVRDAESCWYEVARWPAWVDGVDRVVDVSGNWPAAGASVIWESGPAGRGRVIERVIWYAPLDGQRLQVEDPSIDGKQSVEFTPVEDGVAVILSLEYEIKKRGFFTPLIDLLFIRRAMESSLRSTLRAFGVELEYRRAGAGQARG
jgi:Polyketide cyclase / dehydrase and lipid transport